MRKWIGIVTGTLCVLSSTLRADEAPAVPEAAAEVVPAEQSAAPEVLTNDANQTEKPPAQVGKASVDSSNTAGSSTAAKYVLAASAVAIGVAAIILVSRHHGHHH
jgi:hypothetical protein